MARKKLSEVGPRTIRVHIPTYNKILEFFSLSPSGIRGSDAIRQLLYKFGEYCQHQLESGQTASAKDLRAAEDLVFNVFREENQVLSKDETTK